MEQIAELERRVAAGLDRLVRGIEQLDGARTDDDHDLLTERLEAERMAAAQATERLRAVRQHEGEARAQLEAEIARLSQLLDAQGLEMQRLHQVVVQLREQLRLHREAAEQGQVADEGLVNRAMAIELDALQATRAAEVAELDEILSELAPLIAGARTAGFAGEDKNA